MQGMAASVMGPDERVEKSYALLANAFSLLGFTAIKDFDANRMFARMHGAIQVDEASVDAMIGARHAARKAKNFKEADRIRDELSAMGIQLKDAKDPATGEIVTTWEVRASGATEVKR